MQRGLTITNRISSVYSRDTVTASITNLTERTIVFRIRVQSVSRTCTKVVGDVAGLAFRITEGIAAVSVNAEVTDALVSSVCTGTCFPILFLEDTFRSVAPAVWSTFGVSHTVHEAAPLSVADVWIAGAHTVLIAKAGATAGVRVVLVIAHTVVTRDATHVSANRSLKPESALASSVAGTVQAAARSYG